jgi:hypothetical protein
VACAVTGEWEIVCKGIDRRVEGGGSTRRDAGVGGVGVGGDSKPPDPESGSTSPSDSPLVPVGSME